ncbi:hypothetical protein J4450_03145 [Candidatus Micrarchaeota archaeon]|nr:hypothetical protein [Candidatus Micrarchaeota archaeon]
MNRLNLLAKLQTYVLFTPADIERILGKTRGYAYLYLQRLKQTSLIYEIEKGRYTVYADSFLIASRIVWPSYISGWAALQFYHLTEQLPNVIEVVTTRSRKTRKIKFMNIKIVFSRLRIPHFFGYEKIQYKKFPIFIAEKEKALLDAFLLRHISPSEFMEILKNNKKRVSIKKIKSYSKKISKMFYSKIKKMVNDL